MLGGSKVHLGPRSAGNKSLLSYRAGHGITGYGGYCPSSESIPVPIKEGPSSMCTQGYDRERAQPSSVLFAEVEGRESNYLATHNKSPTAKPGFKTKHPTIATHFGAQDAAALPNQKFIADSLYRSSYSSPSKRKEETADAPFFLSPTRKKPAYLLGSTYAASFDNSMEIVHGQAWLENKEPQLVQSVYGSLWKEVIVQPADWNSSYTLDYGEYGGGLAGKTVSNPMEQSLEATTASLFAGSPKAFKRLPGYQGFLPAGGGGDNIMSQSMDHDRKNTKECRLFTLEQFPTNVPGTGVYRPREPDNVSKIGKGKYGTSTFFANQYLSSPENLAKAAKTRAESKNFGSSLECKKFFTPGALQQSENGYTSAERFYKLIRPYEGIARIGRASATTESGYAFTTYMSKM